MLRQSRVSNQDNWDRAASSGPLWINTLPACAPPHLLLGSALDLFVVQSLSDPGVVFLKLTAGLEVVPSLLFARGSVARSPEPLRSWLTVRGRVRQRLLS